MQLITIDYLGVVLFVSCSHNRTCQIAAKLRAMGLVDAIQKAS